MIRGCEVGMRVTGLIVVASLCLVASAPMRAAERAAAKRPVSSKPDAPGTAKTSLNYEVKLVPDEETAKLGFAPSRDRILLQENTVHSFNYFGGGCLVGPFSAGECRVSRTGDSV